jgi:hypothetical protein
VPTAEFRHEGDPAKFEVKQSSRRTRWALVGSRRRLAHDGSLSERSWSTQAPGRLPSGYGRMALPQWRGPPAMERVNISPIADDTPWCSTSALGLAARVVLSPACRNRVSTPSRSRVASLADCSNRTDSRDKRRGRRAGCCRFGRDSCRLRAIRRGGNSRSNLLRHLSARQSCRGGWRSMAVVRASLAIVMAAFGVQTATVRVSGTYDKVQKDAPSVIKRNLQGDGVHGHRR